MVPFQHLSLQGIHLSPAELTQLCNDTGGLYLKQLERESQDIKDKVTTPLHLGISFRRCYVNDVMKKEACRKGIRRFIMGLFVSPSCSHLFLPPSLLPPSSHPLSSLHMRTHLLFWCNEIFPPPPVCRYRKTNSY